jgi:Stress responsive A/B Barrel Domain
MNHGGAETRRLRNGAWGVPEFWPRGTSVFPNTPLLHYSNTPFPNITPMFTHVVIFWTDPAKPNAPDEVIAGAKKYLRSIPNIVSFQVGKMSSSHRAVVDQSYQVGLCIQFENKKVQDDYQEHPLHLEFIERCKANWNKVVVYDFE